jgi:hypothetical protein
MFPRDHIGVYASSLTPIPPRLLYERRNIRGSQLKVTDLSNYRGKRVLVMTGTEDADHPRQLDGAIVEWLNKNGARADFIYLGDRGIVGNGHMMNARKEQRCARPADRETARRQTESISGAGAKNKQGLYSALRY